MNLISTDLPPEMERRIRFFDKSIGTGTTRDNHAFIYFMIEQLLVVALQKILPKEICIQCNYPQDMWYLADIFVQHDGQDGNLTIYIADPAPFFTVQVCGDFDEATTEQITAYLVDSGLELLPYPFAKKTLYDGILASKNERTTWFNRFFGYCKWS